MPVDKDVRWENIDLKSAVLSKDEIKEVLEILKERLLKANSITQPRIKKAIKRANSLLHSSDGKNKKLKLGGLKSENGVVGRFGGGAGAATFVSGGAPGSKR